MFKGLRKHCLLHASSSKWKHDKFYYFQLPRHYKNNEDITKLNIILESSYIELKWFIGQIIVNELNFNSAHDGSNGCNYDKEFKYHSYGNRLPSKVTDICQGTLLQCKPHEAGYLCTSVRNIVIYI